MATACDGALHLDRGHVARAGGGPARCRGARTLRCALVVALAAVLLAVLAGPAAAQTAPEPPGLDIEPIEPIDDPDAPAEGEGPTVPDVPDIVIDVDSDDPALSNTVVIILLLTIGSVAPGLLLLMTTFTRFIIVFGLTKQALAVQTVPPAQVLAGLALFLSLFVMAPIFSEINDEAVQPMLAGEIGQEEAFEAAWSPLRAFMLEQVEESDLALFVELSGEETPESPEDLGPSTIVPAFVISELRTAFIIGFVVFVPFLIIDLVVAAVLMSLGMVMLPPVFISLPIKLLLFILVDGWALLVGSLVNSVNGVVL